jgi:hypothetical protein
VSDNTTPTVHLPVIDAETVSRVNEDLNAAMRETVRVFAAMTRTLRLQAVMSVALRGDSDAFHRVTTELSEEDWQALEAATLWIGAALRNHRRAVGRS